MEELGHHVEELLHELSVLSLNGHEVHLTDVTVTNYMFFTAISLVLVLTLLLTAARKVSLVPKGISNLVETLVEFVRDDLCGEIIGHGGRKYFPFVGTVFFFILINNLMGLIPGSKPGTGTIGVTLAVGIFVLIYFNYVGIREKGGLKYLKGIVPHGVPGWIAPVIFVLEIISLMLRPFTLAVRLFANMYAGHIILGIFSILIYLAVEPALAHFSGAAVVGALPAIAWLAIMTALYMLEVLVAVVQTYVFTLLTTVYISGAVGDH